MYLQPLNPKSTASGASLTFGASQEFLESGASGPSEGENGRLKIDVAENVHSLLHFRAEKCWRRGTVSRFFLFDVLFKNKISTYDMTSHVCTSSASAKERIWSQQLQLLWLFHSFSQNQLRSKS
jgi:hypothetical protein